ncbi:MAG: hypothetical protein M1832_000325, partial [Thelocarpon impressellum]
EHGHGAAAAIGSQYGHAPYPAQAHRPARPPPPPPGPQPPSQSHLGPHAHPYSARFDGSEVGRVQEAQQSSKGYKGVDGEGYGTSVKRHLDFFDLEASLNEIADSSGRLNGFSRDFKDRARELSRAGPAPGSLPSIAECDEMIRHQGRVQDLLVRLREMLVTQQDALASRHGPEHPFKGSGDYDVDETGPYDDGKPGITMGPDAKKRRGRAAPPGRCHSCNRAETPEWRRGPDGARTLCNACGLHYAKLTRKMGSKAAISGSSLRPKSIGPGSPR